MVYTCGTVSAADGPEVARSSVAETGVDTAAGGKSLDEQWHEYACHQEQNAFS